MRFAVEYPGTGPQFPAKIETMKEEKEAPLFFPARKDRENLCGYCNLKINDPEILKAHIKECEDAYMDDWVKTHFPDSTKKVN